jgi:hypothetical protein
MRRLIGKIILWFMEPRAADSRRQYEQIREAWDDIIMRTPHG